MGSEFTVRIEAEISQPDFSDANGMLSQISEAIVRDIKKNIRGQMDIDGQPFVPLAEKTIQDKLRKASATPRKALMRKEVMLNAIHAYKVNKNNFEIGVIARGNPRRDLVGLIHQEQGVNKHTRIIRKFLGISSKMLKYSNDRVSRWVKQRVGNAKKKYIKII